MRGALGTAITLWVALALPRFGIAESWDPIPKVLIVQNDSQAESPKMLGSGQKDKPASKDGRDKKGDSASNKTADRDPDLSETLAEALAGNAKVEPIVWSSADPLFRQAYQSNKIHWLGGPVSLDEAQAGARALGCNAVIFVYGQRAEVSGYKGLYFRAEMFEGSRKIWQFPVIDDAGQSDVGPMRVPVLVPVKGKDGKTTYKKELKTLSPKLTAEQQKALAMSNWMFISETTGSKADEDNAIASIASTLTSSLNQGPLLNLKVAPALPDTPMNQGLSALIKPQLPASDQVSDDNLTKNLDDLIKNGNESEALSLAHRAVDEQPLDPQRRLLLLKTLKTFGKTTAAIEEAQSAATALGNSAPLLAGGAQIAFDGGEVKEAEAMAIQALAVSHDSFQAKVVLGEVALIQGDPTSSYLQPVPFDSDPIRLQGWVNYVIASTMKGDKAWLDKNVGPSLSKLSAEHQERLLNHLRVEYKRQVIQFKEQVAKCQMAEPAQLKDISAILKDSSSQLEAETDLAHQFSLAFPAEKYLIRNQLAFNLLLQCVQEVQAFIAGGRKGTLDDVPINLSESLHQMNLSQQPPETNANDPSAS